MKQIFYLISVITVMAPRAMAQTSWGENDSRTEYRQDAGLQGGRVASGFYQASAPVNFPAGAGSWWHLLDVRHSNPENNYAMQIAGSFFDQNLYFRKTNNNGAQSWSRILAEADGKVGIGIINPAAPLHVVAGDASLILQATGSDKYAGFNMLDNTGNLAASMQYGNTASSYPNALLLGTRVAAAPLIFLTGAGTNERMRIDGDGNLAIGTADAKGYKLAVNGPAIFTKIKVQPVGSWADYVFHRSFRLLPLAELERYISRHQHLPDIPSADEVASEGLDLGNNQALLLKKIEELTLYVIEQHKQQQADRSAIKLLTRKLEAQQKRIEQQGKLMLQLKK